MKYLTLENKWTVAVLFIFLLAYLILRSFFVGIYLDEAFTFLDYIEPSNLWEDQPNSRSANNHLLTTVLGKGIYDLFGYSLFWLRIPSVLAFCVYFFSTKFIIQKCIRYRFQLLIFCVVNTITWVFEYFGYLRGYGLMLALLTLALVCIIFWIEKRTIKYLFFCFTALILAVLANLAFINSALILFMLLVMHLIYHFKQLSTGTLITAICTLIFFVACIIPVVQYSFQLKEAGALWWGSKSGLWEETGSSLSKLTFGYSYSWMKYAWSILLSIGFIYGIVRCIKGGFFNVLFSVEGVIFTLFYGNLILIELLAQIFEVNYPRDRTAIQLVVLAIILFVLVFQYIRRFNYLLFVLLLIPVSFLIKMNLYSSEYQNNYRITYPINNYLGNNLTDSSSYSIFQVIEPSMNLNLREDEVALLYNKNYASFNCNSTYVLVDRLEDNRSLPPSYSLEMYDDESSIAIYKDQRKQMAVFLRDTLIEQVKIDGEFMEIFIEDEFQTETKGSDFKLVVSGDIGFMKQKSKLFMCYVLADSNNRNLIYEQINLDQIVNISQPIKFKWNSPVFEKNEEFKVLKLYLWNIDEAQINVNRLKVELYKIYQ